MSVLSSSSRAEASLTRMPRRAPRPIPTMMAVGVASPSAQGQAMTSTDTAHTSARAVSPDMISHAANVMTATAMTVGTNHALMRSTRRCTGAFDPCASRTVLTIRASSVSTPTLSARTVSVPVPLSVPAVTVHPGVFSTRSGSPVSMLSSTALSPDVTVPSTGIRSPGRTDTSIPVLIRLTSVSRNSPSAPATSAVFGWSPVSARSAAPVPRRERISISLPVSTNVMIIAAPS